MTPTPTMIDLTPPLENKDCELSRDELRAFAVNSLSRVIAQNIFDALLAATERAIATVQDHDGTENSVRESLTLATAGLFDEIKALVVAVALQHEVTGGGTAATPKHSVASAASDPAPPQN